MKTKQKQFFKKEFIEKNYQKIKSGTKKYFKTFPSLEELYTDKNNWGELLVLYLSDRFSHNPETLKSLKRVFKNIHPIDIMRMDYCRSFSSEMRDKIIKPNLPDFPFMQQINLTPWQNLYLNKDEVSFDSCLKIYEKMKSFSFSDDRFTVCPLYVMPKFGNSRYLDEKYSKLYLDAKLGFSFQFKNKDSMYLSFSFDDNGVYVNQIQGVKGTRGSAHIQDWRIRLVEELKDHFEIPVYVIDGCSLKNKILNAYKMYGGEEAKPNMIAINNIPNIYKIFKSNKTIEKVNLTFHKF